MYRGDPSAGAVLEGGCWAQTTDQQCYRQGARTHTAHFSDFTLRTGSLFCLLLAILWFHSSLWLSAGVAETTSTFSAVFLSFPLLLSLCECVCVCACLCVSLFVFPPSVGLLNGPHESWSTHWSICLWSIFLHHRQLCLFPIPPRHPNLSLWGFWTEKISSVY